jgi:hypothetical protein
MISTNEKSMVIGKEVLTTFFLMIKVSFSEERRRSEEKVVVFPSRWLIQWAALIWTVICYFSLRQARLSLFTLGTDLATRCFFSACLSVPGPIVNCRESMGSPEMTRFDVRQSQRLC